MTKPTKKTPKEASNLFHNIMAESVKGDPKTTNKEQSNIIKTYVFKCISDDTLIGYTLEKNGSELIKNAKCTDGWDFFEILDLPMDSGIYQILKRDNYAITMRIESPE